MEFEFNYIVNKYCGRVYCGNGFFNTMGECLEFIDDGFCDKAIIKDVNTKEVFKYRKQKAKEMEV